MEEVIKRNRNNFFNNKRPWPPLGSITLSSGKILEKRYNQNPKVNHQFLPLDLDLFTNKFLESKFFNKEIFPENNGDKIATIFDFKNKQLILKSY